MVARPRVTLTPERLREGAALAVNIKPTPEFAAAFADHWQSFYPGASAGFVITELARIALADLKKRDEVLLKSAYRVAYSWAQREIRERVLRFLVALKVEVDVAGLEATVREAPEVKALLDPDGPAPALTHYDDGTPISMPAEERALEEQAQRDERNFDFGFEDQSENA